MPARYDVSEVPAQGGYIAKQCPVIAHNRNDPTILAEPVPVSDAMQLMFDRGNEFEDEVFAQLMDLHPDAVLVDRDRATGRTRSSHGGGHGSGGAAHRGRASSLLM